MDCSTCGFDHARSRPAMTIKGAKTQQLAAMPVPGFAPQMMVTVGEALLLEWAAPSNSCAVGVLQQCIAGTPGEKVDLDRVRIRLVRINKWMKKVADYAQTRYSLESLAQRLASPFFLLPGSSYPELLTAAQAALALELPKELGRGRHGRGRRGDPRAARV